jgi:hypothetical protein
MQHVKAPATSYQTVVMSAATIAAAALIAGAALTLNSTQTAATPNKVPPTNLPGHVAKTFPGVVASICTVLLMTAKPW